MAKKINRIYKIRIQDKETKKYNWIIMGDSYKPFEDHFLNIVGHFEKEWKYDDTPQGKGKCLGRTLTHKFISLEKADERFVSFGGLKMAYAEIYNEKVEEHNKNVVGNACKRLEEIRFEPDDKYLNKLLLECSVIENDK
jgi:hypothetical protein